MVRADDLVALDGAERERGAAMDAEIEERMRRSGAVAPEDERLAEQVDGERLAGRELGGSRDRMPAGAKRRSVTGDGRRGHGESLRGRLGRNRGRRSTPAASERTARARSRGRSARRNAGTPTCSSCASTIRPTSWGSSTLDRRGSGEPVREEPRVTGAAPCPTLQAAWRRNLADGRAGSRLAGHFRRQAAPATTASRRPSRGRGRPSADREQEERRVEDDGVSQRADETCVHRRR